MGFRLVTGWFLLFLALMALGAEILVALETGSYGFLALGEIWFRIDAGSLGLVQAVVQRYIHPLLWDPVITSLLFPPGWLVLGFLGGILVFFGRRAKRRKAFASG